MSSVQAEYKNTCIATLHMALLIVEFKIYHMINNAYPNSFTQNIKKSIVSKLLDPCKLMD